MSTIKLRRNTTPGSIPTTGNLAVGEVALNTADGKLFFKKTVSGIESIVTLQQINAGTGVNIDTGGNVSIGQDVSTTASPSFSGANISPDGFPSSLTVNSSGQVSIANTLKLNGTITDSVNSTGSNYQVLTSTGTGVRWRTQTGGGGAGLTVRNTQGANGSVTTEVTDITGINFDKSTGINVADQGDGNVFVSLGSSFKTIKVAGQSDVVAVGEDTLELIAGTGITLETHPTATKSITITNSGSTAPIKTFNILGDFGLLPGTARFYPAAQDTIKSVVLSVGVNRSSDLTVGLYNSNQFLQFFTIPSGQNYALYTGLNYVIYPGESYTVNVVGGNGTNLSMALFNINL
jgi:hypothetical protein